MQSESKIFLYGSRGYAGLVLIASDAFGGQSFIKSEGLHLQEEGIHGKVGEKIHNY